MRVFRKQGFFVIALVVALVLFCVPAIMAGPQEGDIAFGPSYTYVATDYDFDSRAAGYGLSLEMWGSKHQSFQAGAEKSTDLDAYSGFAAAAYNLGPIFAAAGVSYAEEAGAHALLGAGLNLTAKQVNLHLRADYLVALDRDETEDGLWKASGALRFVF